MFVNSWVFVGRSAPGDSIGFKEVGSCPLLPTHGGEATRRPEIHSYRARNMDPGFLRETLESAMLAFETAAQQRIEEIATSPPEDPGTGGGFVVTAISTSSGFAFALRSLQAMAQYGSDLVVSKLIPWHARETARIFGLQATDEERAVRDCAVNCVFCEALLAALRDKKLKELGHNHQLEDRALDFFHADSPLPRQEASRRRLAALGGRSEEKLWTELIRTLCQHRFESVSDKILNKIEKGVTGGGATPGRGRAAAPERSSLAMCLALQGLQLPPACSSAASAQRTFTFLKRLQDNVLTSKPHKGLHKPVCEALGSALLEQQAEAAGLRARDADAAASDHGAGGRATADAVGSSRSSGGWAEQQQHGHTQAMADIALRLHRLQLQLSSWALTFLGLKNTIMAKFETWPAPLATALLCAASAPGLPLPHTERRELYDLHYKLQLKLFKCIESHDPCHRLVGLRCLALQLPVLVAECTRTRGQCPKYKEIEKAIRAIFFPVRRKHGAFLSMKLDVSTPAVERARATHARHARLSPSSPRPLLTRAHIRRREGSP